MTHLSVLKITHRGDCGQLCLWQDCIDYGKMWDHLKHNTADLYHPLPSPLFMDLELAEHYVSTLF